MWISLKYEHIWCHNWLVIGFLPLSCWHLIGCGCLPRLKQLMASRKARTDIPPDLSPFSIPLPPYLCPCCVAYRGQHFLQLFWRHLNSFLSRRRSSASVKLKMSGCFPFELQDASDCPLLFLLSIFLPSHFLLSPFNFLLSSHYPSLHLSPLLLPPNITFSLSPPSIFHLSLASLPN